MSHYSGVNSTRAELVVGSTLAYSFWQKVMDAPWGVATRKNLLWWGGLHFTAQIFCLIRGRTFCDLVRYFVFYFIPLTIYLPFSLKHVSLCPIHVSRHQWGCACKWIIISSWSLPFIFGWVLGLNASSLEALVHLLNIGRNPPNTCIHTHYREKVNQKF